MRIFVWNRGEKPSFRKTFECLLKKKFFSFDDTLIINIITPGMERFDLTVIGSGPGGYVSAIRAAQLGMKVAVVERDKPGGVCLNWGCIPSKAILKCAEMYSHFLNSKDYGITCDKLSFDYPEVIKKSRKASTSLNRGVLGLLNKNKISFVNGTARLASKHLISVSGEKPCDIESERILIATGSVPRTLPGLEIDGKVLMTSDEAIMHPEVPRSIVIIGGGYIGMEFAYVYNSFGSKVTIVELEKQIMPGADEEVAEEAKKIFTKQGMSILTNTAYKSLEKTANSATVTVKNRISGEETSLKAEMVLVSVGRKAVANSASTSFAFYGKSKGMGLEEVGVEFDENGFIKTDENYMTACSNVYAIGDVIGGPMLAHKASEEGVVAVERMKGMNSRVHYDSIPGCVYCQPEVAMIGLTEKQARDRGYQVDIGKFPFKASGKAVAVGETDGFVKIIFDSKTKELLGSHIIGHGATEMIAEIGVAKTLETTPYEIASTQHAHPTLSEAVMEAALDALGRVRNF